MIFLTKFQKLTILVSALFAIYEFILFILIFVPSHAYALPGIIGNFTILLFFMVITYFLEMAIHYLLVNNLKPNYLKFKGLVDGIGSSILLFLSCIFLFFIMKIGTYAQLLLVISFVSLLIAFTLASFASKYGDF